MNPRRDARPPHTLYKYYPPERIDVLDRLHVRFSPPTDFNDAFDSFHSVPPEPIRKLGQTGPN